MKAFALPCCRGLVLAAFALTFFGWPRGGKTPDSAAFAEKPGPAAKKTSPKRKDAAKPDKSPQGAAPGGSDRPQRVVRPTFEVPRHDDRRLEKLGINRYESKHIILYTDIAPQLARPLPRLIDQAYAAWEEYFGPLPPDRSGAGFQMIGYLMHDRALFREAGLLTDDIRISLEGVFRNQVFWMEDRPIDYNRRNLMLHEATHCFMFAFPNPTNRFPWYVEGMPELFRTHLTDGEGRTRFRVFPHDDASFPGLGRFQLIESDLRAGGPWTIEAITGLHPGDFQKYNAYAWSWALCAFLDGHPRYRDRFRRLGSLVTSRNGSGVELQEVYQADWRDLSEEWLVFAGNVCPAYDIERTVLDLRAGKAAASGAAESKVEIAAGRGWQSSGVLVEQGKSYEIRGEGRCVVAQTSKPWESEPQGISFRYHAGVPLGMLVATVRSEARLEKTPYTTMLHVIPIGRERRITPDVTGTLYFRVNDFWGELADNTGAYRVTLKAHNDQ